MNDSSSVIDGRTETGPLYKRTVKQARPARNSMKLLASNPLSVNNADAINAVKLENTTGCVLITEAQMIELVNRVLNAR